MKIHDKIYTALLLVTAILLLATIVGIMMLWAFDPREALLYFLVGSEFLALIVGTMALRLWKPDTGRIFTLALNIALLFYVPVGTVIAIYGFWKIDKEPTESIKKHESNYLAILIAAAFTSLILTEIAMSTPANPFVVLYLFSFVALTGGTAVLRLLKPQAGKIASQFLNIVLLAFFPVGTAIAIYGFLKVDKKINTDAQP